MGRFGSLSPARADRPRPVVIWQSDTLTRALQSVLVIPLTTNLDPARLAGTAMIEASENGLSQTSVALSFQMRAVPKACLLDRIRNLTKASLVNWNWQPMKHWGRVEPETE